MRVKAIAKARIAELAVGTVSWVSAAEVFRSLDGEVFSCMQWKTVKSIDRRFDSASMDKTRFILAFYHPRKSVTNLRYECRTMCITAIICVVDFLNFPFFRHQIHKPV